ncbi:MAG: hypothetical protein XD62_0841 [Methanosarcinales archeaon 56_1174]|uniref:type IV toxin-antitoxin system AbiEi family antitoxin domain-containing protein n=1 Tax=Methermicoccus shengliensis TaxID=660064 RepID=UPI0005B2CD18|nr:hypothetical protein [Methermicoccus shengliensis]KUK04265.1 MAG: hypothetical protein XD46_0990 [Euryarchaeota archaeon 55_53]KUK30055.1 MAG: hypothetical protein XD62_0841 [Methanosarcinales archeaon 56_1174]MDN5295141.1 hypothetical protein [Methanosarcinales archaeon]
MKKNYYLTKSEQLVFRVIENARIISTTELKDLFPELSEEMIYKVASSLERKGYLYRLKKGLYLVQKTPSKEPLIENPYEIALSIFKGYIAFSSALRLYDLIEYEPFTIFVATPEKSGRVELNSYTVRAVSMGERAIGITFYRGVYISTKAKTFFDCFYKPQYAGGYETITKALFEVKNMDWDEFLSYFKKFASPSLCQRTGYILDLMRRELDFKVPENVLLFFKGRVKTRTRLIPTAPSKGRFISAWKVTDNLGKERILGWAYGA